MRALLLLLALAAPLCADILIGDRPCLWKRAVVKGVFKTRLLDTGSVWDKPVIRYRLKYHAPNCDKAAECWGGAWGLDTTGWETYWDSCPQPDCQGEDKWKIKCHGMRGK